MAGALASMSYFTYTLKSKKNGCLHIGMTFDVEKRLKQHNSGKTSSNRHNTPFEVIYTKEFLERKEARKYEKYLKSGIGRGFFEECIIVFAQVAELVYALA